MGIPFVAAYTFFGILQLIVSEKIMVSIMYEYPLAQHLYNSIYIENSGEIFIKLCKKNLSVVTKNNLNCFCWWYPIIHIKKNRIYRCMWNKKNHI